MNLIKEIEDIYIRNSLSFMLFKYINKNFYNEIIQTIFKNNKLENLTDFNYSKCFSISINLSDTDALLGSEEFTEYLKTNLCLYKLEIQISILAPYTMRKYLKYEESGGQLLLTSNDNPFLKEHFHYEGLVLHFIKEIGYTLLCDTELTRKVSNITLELQDETPSVYNCLFEDSSSFYPYTN